MESAPPQDPARLDAATDTLLLHKGVLRSFFRARIQVADEAEDCVQEVYARVLASMPETKIENWRAFLLKVASNLVVERFRRGGAQRRAAIPVPLEDAADVPAEPTLDPERQLAGRQELALLLRALGELDPVRREAFCLVRIDGCSHREVAARLGIEVTAVGRHIERTMAHLLRSGVARQGAGGLP